MSGIVERLREAGDDQDGNWSIYDDAADEIERLRADLAEAEALLRRARDCIDGMDADLWRLLPAPHYSRGTPAACQEIDAWLARRTNEKAS